MNTNKNQLTQLVIAIGSNQQREYNICAALDALTQLFGELAISPVYRSLAQRNNSNDEQAQPYFNLVVALETDRELEQIKPLLTAIEAQQGRARNSTIVTLDLDILLYGDWVGKLDNNTVPHHDISQCAYVLRPLADLLPTHLHPVYEKNYKDMWDEYTQSKDFVANLEPIEFVWQERVVSSASCLPLM